MCDDPKTRDAWDTAAGLGRKKLFEVRSIHNDISFIDEFLDEDFAHKQKMFIYDYDRQRKRYVISNRNFKEIKLKLLEQLTNFGQPVINVVDGNYKNRSELLLKHDYDSIGLKANYANETLKNLYKIWRRPVHIRTLKDKAEVVISYDGTSTKTEKAQD
jgi:stage V sporulation protein R